MKETMEHITGLFRGISDYFAMKVVPSFFIPLFGLMFGFQSQGILKGLLALIVIDFITGILSAYKTGEHIRSKRAVKSAYKVAIYGLLVSAGHVTENIIPATFFIEEIVTSFLALTEFISITENVGKMGFAVPQRLLNKLQEFRDSK